MKENYKVLSEHIIRDPREGWAIRKDLQEVLSEQVLKDAWQLHGELKIRRALWKTNANRKSRDSAFETVKENDTTRECGLEELWKIRITIQAGSKSWSAYYSMVEILFFLLKALENDLNVFIGTRHVLLFMLTPSWLQHGKWMEIEPESSGKINLKAIVSVQKKGL